MTFTAIETPRFSDVVIREDKNKESREIVTVNMSTGATLKLGTVLARTISADSTAAYDIVKATDVVDSATALTKEYAILIGDFYNVQDEVVFATGVAKKAYVFVREASVKEAPVLAIHDAALSDNEWRFLKGAMAKQALLVEPTAPITTVV